MMVNGKWRFLHLSKDSTHVPQFRETTSTDQDPSVSLFTNEEIERNEKLKLLNEKNEEQSIYEVASYARSAKSAANELDD